MLMPLEPGLAYHPAKTTCPSPEPVCQKADEKTNSRQHVMSQPKQNNPAGGKNGGNHDLRVFVHVIHLRPILSFLSLWSEGLTSGQSFFTSEVNKSNSWLSSLNSRVPDGVSA